MLFSERSIWTMVHGTGLGRALVGLAAALFYLYATRPDERRPGNTPPGTTDMSEFLVGWSSRIRAQHGSTRSRWNQGAHAVDCVDAHHRRRVYRRPLSECDAETALVAEDDVQPRGREPNRGGHQAVLASRVAVTRLRPPRFAS
jgi:hypothetical protein